MLTVCNLKKGKSVFDDTERVLSLAKFTKGFCGNIRGRSYLYKK